MAPLNLVIVNTSSSREVIGGGDIRLLGLIYAINKINKKLNNKINLILISDKYYYDSLRKLASDSNILSPTEFDDTVSRIGLLGFPRYLPPYKKGTFMLKLLLFLINSIKLFNLIKRGYTMVMIHNNQLYQYVVGGLDILAGNLVVYAQTPVHVPGDIIASIIYKGFLGILKLLGKFINILLFVFNPIDLKILRHIFRHNSKVIIRLTTNGIFYDLIRSQSSSEKYYDIVYLGRLDERKGAFKNFYTFIKKLNEISIKAKIAIVTSALGSEIRQLKTKLIKLSNNHKIDLYVNVPPSKVYEILSRSRVLVMLSSLDVFNMAILEAITNGCNVIALRNPRIVSSYNSLATKYPFFISYYNRIFFVDNVDEAVQVYKSLQSLQEKYTKKNINNKNNNDINLKILDWYYIVLNELKVTLPWLLGHQ